MTSKAKKEYSTPSICITLIEAERPLQSSTGAQIPDAGWGNKKNSSSRRGQEQEEYIYEQNLW